MTPSEFAARLNGREYGEEITKAEEAEARGLGYVVVFGYSDDNVELRGAINDEVGAYDGTTLRITSSGLVPSFDSLDHDDEAEMEAYFNKKREPGRDIEAVWSGPEGYSWTFKTDIPHATFDVMKGDDKFCRGIVFRSILS